MNIRWLRDACRSRVNAERSHRASVNTVNRGTRVSRVNAERSHRAPGLLRSKISLFVFVRIYTLIVLVMSMCCKLGGRIAEEGGGSQIR
jgi:hypothetical protein